MGRVCLDALGSSWRRIGGGLQIRGCIRTDPCCTSSSVVPGLVKGTIFGRPIQYTTHLSQTSPYDPSPTPCPRNKQLHHHERRPPSARHPHPVAQPPRAAAAPPREARSAASIVPRLPADIRQGPHCRVRGRVRGDLHVPFVCARRDKRRQHGAGRGRERGGAERESEQDYVYCTGLWHVAGRQRVGVFPHQWRAV
jgi:hypothetical protein